MKKMILVSVLMLYSMLDTYAQVRVNVNIGTQPLWGPVGYDYVEYYYIPDCDAYYDVPNGLYIYFDNGVWVHRRYLPPVYRNVDIYRVHKVVINERNPWMHHSVYHDRYARYRGAHDQVIIRDSRDSRYWQNPGHPRYHEWKGGGHGNERHEDHGHGGGHGHDKGGGHGHRR